MSSARPVPEQNRWAPTKDHHSGRERRARPLTRKPDPTTQTAARTRRRGRRTPASCRWCRARSSRRRCRRAMPSPLQSVSMTPSPLTSVEVSILPLWLRSMQSVDVVGDLGHRRLAAERAVGDPQVAVEVDRGARRIVACVMLHLLVRARRLARPCGPGTRVAVVGAAAVRAVAGGLAAGRRSSSR